MSYIDKKVKRNIDLIKITTENLEKSLKYGDVDSALVRCATIQNEIEEIKIKLLKQ